MTNGIGLRDVARVHEIDRQLLQIRLGRTGVTLVLFPGLAVCVYLIVPPLIAGWAAVSTLQLWFGVLTVATSVGATIQGVRAKRATAARLEEERQQILAGRSVP